jgi:anti-sigma B factor antagonist
MGCVIRQEGVTIVRLGPSYDSLDDRALEEFGGMLLAEATYAEPPQLVLDFLQTTHIGSSFIELLVRAWKRLNQRNGTMVLCSVQPFCREVLQITRLDSLWTMYPTEEEAVSALSRRGSEGGSAA